KYLDVDLTAGPGPDGFEDVEGSAFGSADGMQPATDHVTEATAVIPVGPDDAVSGYTSAGEVLGTLAYMPPEQARGDTGAVDGRGDVFALGAILCQILTGGPPYFGPIEVMKVNARNGRLFGAFIILERCGAAPSLIRLAKLCLAADPDDRPTDAGALARMVIDCLDGLQTRARDLEFTRLMTEARLAEVEARECLARRARRQVRALAVLAVLTAGALTAGIGWANQKRGNPAPADTRPRAMTIGPTESAIVEAELQNERARIDPDGPRARHAAAERAAIMICQAEALFDAVPGIGGELRERFSDLKRRVTETERDTRRELA